MVFLGFLILQNKVKAATPGVINELRSAHIRSVMVCLVLAFLDRDL